MVRNEERLDQLLPCVSWWSCLLCTGWVEGFATRDNALLSNATCGCVLEMQVKPYFLIGAVHPFQQLILSKKKLKYYGL